MLDAINNLPKETEESAVDRSAATPAVASFGFPMWGAALPGFEAQRAMAATMMMAPFAMAQSSASAIRRGRALIKHWGEEAMHCRSLGALIDVNRRYGERAMAMAANESMRMFEQGAQLGRAAATPPSSLSLR